MVTDVVTVRDRNFKHFKTFVGASRNGIVDHCITNLNTDDRR